ncbi:hypothetical protein BCR34DRAFT_561977 [Clohesyomyces aquaticus]|uniref:Uncharacterized protein n=1 Tax=Clohesyomyces aquaticus TaxID=1231657 RepID=A0A1Y1ZTA4_9PLEO|nr:hypothetical protein BCR34DRAFT_561977 [Clohesyomyces aquaticus]
MSQRAQTAALPHRGCGSQPRRADWPASRRHLTSKPHARETTVESREARKGRKGEGRRSSQSATDNAFYGTVKQSVRAVVRFCFLTDRRRQRQNGAETRVGRGRNGCQIRRLSCPRALPDYEPLVRVWTAEGRAVPAPFPTPPVGLRLDCGRRFQAPANGRIAMKRSLLSWEER